MNTITVWLLISVNSAWFDAPSGHYTVIAKFPTAQDCEHVKANLPRQGTNTQPKCIQARIVQ